MRSSYADTLEDAIRFLECEIQRRMKKSFPPPDNSESSDSPTSTLKNITSKKWLNRKTPLTNFIRDNKLNKKEQLILLMALAPHLKPNLYDRLITSQLPQNGDYPQIGGWRGTIHRGFLPTGETVLFILAGDELSDRLELQALFQQEHTFASKRVLYLEPASDGEPLMSGKLIMHQDYVNYFTQGKMSSPHFSTQFPAERINTEMEWEDLVLNPHTRQQIDELDAWLTHGDTILYDLGLKKNLKLGYRVLFHGPPGTGKTLAASLLGKYSCRDIYKIDLSMVVSKFIGETEKNLANLFTRAENKNWILFFDEADALFGKRTNVRDAHDKYANQEVSYLLQRVENYDGLVILASNFKSNIDEAFIRRFQSIINFPIPTSKERLELWKNILPSKEFIELDESIDLTTISSSYELTGADITNIVQHCCLRVLQRGDNSKIILPEDLNYSIKREFRKSGKNV